MSCYLSLTGTVSFEVNIKRSVFIGNAAHCETEEEAKRFIRDVAAKYRDASHNCWAYKVIGNGVEKFNFSDAGEPHGSAGRPIFSAIEELNMTNVAIVITRYFGGTKLGVRGLIDAYRSTARSTLEQGEKGRYCPGKVFSVQVNYSIWNMFVGKFVEGKDFNIQDIDFGVSIKAKISCRLENLEAIVGFFKERRIDVEMNGDIVFVEKL